MSYTEERLEKFLVALMNQCIWGALHSRIAQLIGNHLKNQPRDLEHCSWPLSVTELAHWDSALLTLIRLLSRDKQSLTVHKLLRIAEGNWALFEHVDRDVVFDKVRRDRARIEELEPLLQKLKDVRDKYVVHLDALTLKQAPRRIQGKDLHPMDRVEQVNLQGVTESMVASYYEMYHNCEFDFDLGEHSYSWLLSVLVERGRQHNE